MAQNPNRRMPKMPKQYTLGEGAYTVAGEEAHDTSGSDFYVEVPKDLGVKLVKATDFGQYNLFYGLTTISLTISTFFWSMYSTEWTHTGVLISSILFTFAFLFFGRRTYRAYSEMVNSAQVRQDVTGDRDQKSPLHIY